MCPLARGSTTRATAGVCKARASSSHSEQLIHGSCRWLQAQRRSGVSMELRKSVLCFDMSTM
eukprot:2111393-Alexandrium_andersonii.AAC.1